MNKKFLIPSILFLLLLLYFLIFETRIEEKEKTKNNLFHYTMADIKKLEIEKNGKIIQLERILNDWLIKKPRELPASKSDIDSYLYEVKDLQKEQIIGENVPDLSLYGLKNPKIVLKIWLSQKKGEQLLTLHLGDQNPDQTGYYAKIENEPQVFLLENVAESTIDKDVFAFREKIIFQVKEEDISKIELSQDKEKYEFTLHGDKWIMNNPIMYSNINQEEVIRSLNSILGMRIKKFFDEDNKVNIADAGLLNPSMRIKLIDKKNKSILLEIGKEIKQDTGLYAKLKENPLIFEIDKTLLDGVIKDFKNFETKKEEEDKKVEEEKLKQKSTKQEENDVKKK